MNLFRTILEFTLKDKATSGLQRLNTSIKGAGKSAAGAAENFKQLAGAFTALVVATRLKQALTGIIEPARKMEQAMTRLSFTSNKAGASLLELRAAAERTAEQTIFGPQAAMDAVVSLNRALRDTESTTRALDVSAGLAQASFGKMSLEKSGKMIANMSKAFGMGANDIEASGDKIQAVALATGMGTEALADVMGRLGQAAVLGGQSFDAMLASFGIMSRLMQSPLQASTLLVSMFAKLGSGKTQAALGQIGVQVKSLDGAMRPISEIMAQISDAAAISMDDVRDSLREAFGVRTIKPMLSMIAGMERGIRDVNGRLVQGSALFTDLNRVMDTSAGSIARGVSMQMNTADAQMRRFNEAIVKLSTALGEKLLPILMVMAATLATSVDMLIKFLNLPYVGRIAQIVMISMALGAAFMAARLMLGGMRDLLRFAMIRLGQFGVKMRGATASTNINTASLGRATAMQRLHSGAMRIGIIRLMRLRWMQLKANHSIDQAAIITRRASLTMGGYDRLLTITQKRMWQWPKLMGAFSYATRGAKVAMTGLKWAVKGLLSSTGLGLLLAFLPEIIGYIKELHTWGTKLATDVFDKILKGVKGSDAEGGWLYSLAKILTPENILQQYAKGKAFVAEVEDYKNYSAEMRRQLDLLAAKKARDLLLIGGSSFKDAVEGMKAMLGHKPQAIDANALARMQSLVGKVAGGKAGAAFRTIGGASLEDNQGNKGLTQGDITAGQRAQNSMTHAMRMINEAQAAGNAPNGEDWTNLARSMEASIVLLRSTSGDTKSIDMIQKMAEKTLGPLLHSMSPESGAMESLRRVLYGNKDISTGKDIKANQRGGYGPSSLHPAQGGPGYNSGSGASDFGPRQGPMPWVKENPGHAFLAGPSKKEIEEQRLIENNVNLSSMQASMHNILLKINKINTEGVKVETTKDPALVNAHHYVGGK